jgi:hypothetical protein
MIEDNIPANEMYCPWCHDTFTGEPVCRDCGHPLALRVQISVRWLELHARSERVTRAQKEIIRRVESQHRNLMVDQLKAEIESNRDSEKSTAERFNESVEGISDRFDRWYELADEGRYAPHRREQDGGPRDDGG